MTLTRLAAVLAIPGMLSLAACAGGSSAGIANISGNTANVRIVNGNAGTAYDVYFQTTGSGAPTTPIDKAIAYGVASDYLTQPAAAASFIVQTANGPAPSTNTGQVASCPLPQLASNGKYSIVIVTTGSIVTCRLFQDFDYTGAPQMRVHEAASNATSVLGFGIVASPNAPIGTSFSVLGQTSLGNVAAGLQPSFTTTQPIGITPNASGSSTFVLSNERAGTGTAIATLDSTHILSANGTAQPDTTGALNPAGAAGTSLFLLDCVGTTTGVTGVPCVNGAALFGYTDRL